MSQRVAPVKTLVKDVHPCREDRLFRTNHSVMIRTEGAEEFWEHISEKAKVAWLCRCSICIRRFQVATTARSSVTIYSEIHVGDASWQLLYWSSPPLWPRDTYVIPDICKLSYISVTANWNELVYAYHIILKGHRTGDLNGNISENVWNRIKEVLGIRSSCRRSAYSPSSP